MAGGRVEEAGCDRWANGTLLADLCGSPDAAKPLLSVGTVRSYHAGEHLLIEGLRETFVLLLLSGVTKVTATSEDGDTALLAVRLGGDLVGEFAAFDNRPRSATVTAAGPVTVRRIGQRDFLDCLDSSPAVALAVSRMLVRKNRWSVRRRGDFSGSPVATRVARVLVDLMEDYGEPLRVGVLIGPRLTQAELAGLVGAKERRVHHVLGELARPGADPGRLRPDDRALAVRTARGRAADRVAASLAFRQRRRTNGSTARMRTDNNDHAAEYGDVLATPDLIALDSAIPKGGGKPVRERIGGASLGRPLLYALRGTTAGHDAAGRERAILVCFPFDLEELPDGRRSRRSPSPSGSTTTCTR